MTSLRTLGTIGHVWLSMAICCPCDIQHPEMVFLFILPSGFKCWGLDKNVTIKVEGLTVLRPPPPPPPVLTGLSKGAVTRKVLAKSLGCLGSNLSLDWSLGGLGERLRSK